MKATERPGAAQVTATPRSVTAPRQMNLPTLHDVREAPFGTRAVAILVPADRQRSAELAGDPGDADFAARAGVAAALGPDPDRGFLRRRGRGGPGRSSRRCPRLVGRGAAAGRRHRSRRWRARRARSCSALLAASAPNLAGALEGTADRGVEHRLGQPAGEGVLLARVVAADQRPAADLGPRRRGRSAAAGAAPRAERRAAPAAPRPRRRSRARRRPARGRAARARAPGTAGRGRARRGSACCRAARSARRR